MTVCVFGGGEGGRHCLSTVYVQAKVIFFLFLKFFVKRKYIWCISQSVHTAVDPTWLHWSEWTECSVWRWRMCDWSMHPETCHFSCLPPFLHNMDMCVKHVMNCAWYIISLLWDFSFCVSDVCFCVRRTSVWLHSIFNPSWSRLKTLESGV